MDYGKYKDARNASWQCILDFNINKLPVMVTDIIKKSESIRLFKESDVHMLENSESGKTILHNGFLKLSIVIQNHHIVADLQYRTNSVTSF